MYLFVALLKDLILSDFHIRIMKAYITLLTLSKLFTLKYQNIIIPGQVDKGLFTIHPYIPRVYYTFISNNIQNKFSLRNPYYFILSLGTLNLEFASWKNAGPETNHKCLEDYTDYRCQYYYKCIFHFKI